MWDQVVLLLRVENVRFSYLRQIFPENSFFVRSLETKMTDSSFPELFQIDSVAS